MNELKYQQFLDLYNNCPPALYDSEREKGYRWVKKDNLKDSFLPLHLMKEPPPRMLDNSDLMCKGYGLSFFDTEDNSLSQYKSLYKMKRGLSYEDFVSEKGDSVAYLEIKEQGITGDFNMKSGHFTFHEFHETNLAHKILTQTPIFDSNGNFIV